MLNIINGNEQIKRTFDTKPGIADSEAKKVVIQPSMAPTVMNIFKPGGEKGRDRLIEKASAPLMEGPNGLDKQQSKALLALSYACFKQYGEKVRLEMKVDVNGIVAEVRGDGGKGNPDLLVATVALTNEEVDKLMQMKDEDMLATLDRKMAGKEKTGSSQPLSGPVSNYYDGMALKLMLSILNAASTESTEKMHDEIVKNNEEQAKLDKDSYDIIDNQLRKEEEYKKAADKKKLGEKDMETGQRQKIVEQATDAAMKYSPAFSKSSGPVEEGFAQDDLEKADKKSDINEQIKGEKISD